MASDARRRRLDATQNREAILAVALAALTESSEVSLNAIAKRAGVANATLYRHFPTRESLVLEVYQHEVGQVVEAADLLLATQTPADALRDWVERLAQYAMTKHGLAGAYAIAGVLVYSRDNAVDRRQKNRVQIGDLHPVDVGVNRS